ncbi:MAG: 4Fe-4S dicluster domain-containing protein [Deltaproteobacteria bacterium]|nr:4Fe-4S dicluster domain-containing protein [Deltaproteobacteria bacterium]
MSQKKAIFVKISDCVGCLTCELSCGASHKSIPRLVVEAQGLSPVPVLCRHCEEAPCVDACMSGSMHKIPEKGIIINDEERCVGCFMCAMACPYGVIFSNGEGKLAYKCDLCYDKEEPVCVTSCPMYALRYTTLEQFEDEVRRESVSSLW